LVRSADGGAVVAIILLAHANGAAGWLTGVLGACITAPHLLGPFVARRLDTARDGRILITGSAVLHGTLLAGAALLLPITPAVVPGALLVASGLFGPMLTGGISSRLPSIAGPSRHSQRRAQGWDVASYGISGTLGPAAVAWIATAADPQLAALALAATAVLGAGTVMLLPYRAPAARPGDVPSPSRTLALMVRSGPLRRTLGLTVVVAFAVAALPIHAVAVAPRLGATAAAGGTLVAAYGVGNLIGSALVMIRPARSDADPLMSRLAVVVAGGLALVLLAPSFPLALLAFSLAGVLNACFFAATLAGRSEFAPREARGQVFIWVGALKIAAGSAGTAAAGATVTHAAWLPLVLGISLALAAAVGATTDRRGGPAARLDGPQGRCRAEA
jgi:MFS family permease